MQHLHYLEFYSGVGGWTMALQKAVSTWNNNLKHTCNPGAVNGETNSKDEITTECSGTFDHSDLCNLVYRHNFLTRNNVSHDGKERCSTKDRPSALKSVRIEQLTVNDMLQRYHADIWMMSPPCQPHTRQHNNQQNDVDDPRSNSFLHLCQLLSEMMIYESSSIHSTNLKMLPSIIVLENVIGFESSKSCNIWIQTLLKCKYRIAQFHLQPTQIGIPNDRPRYYCVATLQRQRNVFENGHCEEYTSTTNHWMERYFTHAASYQKTTPSSVATKDNVFNCPIHTSLEELGVLPEDKVDHESLPKLKTYLDPNNDNNSELLLSAKTLERPASWCFDIVTPNSQRTSCFTSSYGKYTKGTGSVLLYKRMNRSGITTENDDDAYAHVDKKYRLMAPQERQYDPNWSSYLLSNGYDLRQFSDVELIRLFGYMDTFSFPIDVTMKQRWRLIGNSLNVTLCSKLLELALQLSMPFSGE